MSYLFIIALVGFLILIHELGHFLAARWVDIPIARFSIGFGPLLCSFRRGGTQFGLAWFPFGGYVLPDVKDDREFLNIPGGRRIFFSLGGPAANVLLSVLLFSLLNAMGGHTSAMNLLIDPWRQTAELIASIFAVIPKLFANPQHLSGIVGIVTEGREYVGFDPVRAVHFAILLNLNLAVFNMLPLPALDGGKILLACAEKVWPGSRRLHLPLAVASWILLIGLMLFATLMDVMKAAA